MSVTLLRVSHPKLDFTKDPYPYAIDECFDLYNALVHSNGQVIGMSGQDLKLILSGDSA
jgi:hypothetical protein